MTRKSMPSWWPMSCSAQMRGCESRAIARASCSKRARPRGSLAASGDSTLIATGDRAACRGPCRPRPSRQRRGSLRSRRRPDAPGREGPRRRPDCSPVASPARAGRMERNPSASPCAASSDSTSSRNAWSPPHSRARNEPRSASGRARAASKSANTCSRRSAAITIGFHLRWGSLDMLACQAGQVCLT